jgi:N-acetylglutamate synthase-like GNAT family acetyltransferase
VTTIRSIRKADEGTVRALLQGENLPVDILDEKKGETWVMEHEGVVVGSGAFEFYGTDALLRSLVMSTALKGRGRGSILMDYLETEALERGVHTIWLLTETAEAFFSKRGYRATDRSVVVNQGILTSSEFTHLCASTAVCMRKIISGASSA